MAASVVDLGSEDLQFADRSSCSPDKLFSLGNFSIPGQARSSHFSLFQGLTVSQARTMQEYYDNIDKRDPRKAVVVPKVDDEDISRFGTMILAFISIILVLVTLPFSLCYCVKVVQEYERAVIFRLGRLKKGGASGPGLFFILPCIDKYSCVDLRTVSYEVPPQEMLSRDSVTVSVDAVCFYKVTSQYILLSF